MAHCDSVEMQQPWYMLEAMCFIQLLHNEKYSTGLKYMQYGSTYTYLLIENFACVTSLQTEFPCRQTWKWGNISQPSDSGRKLTTSFQKLVVFIIS